MTAPVKPTTRRQRRRTRQLDELAQSVGYPTWGRLGTAALRGEVVVVKVEPQGERKVAPHRITVTGCDAHTTIIIPLTPAELALVELIADAITRTSSYRCMPTMSVGPA